MSFRVVWELCYTCIDLSFEYKRRTPGDADIDELYQVEQVWDAGIVVTAASDSDIMGLK